jgi:hypothetical protein
VADEVVDPPVGLEDADGLHGQDLVEQRGDAGAFRGGVQHRQAAVGQDRGLEALILEGAEHGGRLRVGVELEVEVQQGLAILRRAAAHGLQRPVETVGRHLPEIGVHAGGGAQPGVLELLEPPELRDAGPERVEIGVALALREPAGGGGDVEEGAVRRW